MICDKIIPDLLWSVQGHIFTSEAGVLPLKCYDMILGEDWLESCSPMWVHWKKKVMKFTHKGKRIILHGVKPEVSRCSPISAGKLKGLIRRNVVSCCLQLKIQKTQDSAWSDDQLVCSFSKPNIEGECLKSSLCYLTTTTYFRSPPLFHLQDSVTTLSH